MHSSFYLCKNSSPIPNDYDLDLDEQPPHASQLTMAKIHITQSITASATSSKFWHWFSRNLLETVLKRAGRQLTRKPALLFLTKCQYAKVMKGLVPIVGTTRKTVFVPYRLAIHQWVEKRNFYDRRIGE